MTCNQDAFPVMLQWKRDGVLPLTPAHKWVHGRFAQAYHRFIQSPEMVHHMRNRRTSVEPPFDLIVNAKWGLPLRNISDIATAFQ